MPEVIRGIRSHDSNHSHPTPTSPDAADLRVTFDQGRVDSSNSLRHVKSDESKAASSRRRRSSYHDREERDAYYDSRAATKKEFRPRASTLQQYYVDHPDLLPQIPFTLRHGFKRWKLAGYIALIVIDACVNPIVLYYAMTFAGNVEGYITFAVVTAIWGGPTYVEFALRSWRLIKKKDNFFKPLGINKRWGWDITNWIFVLTITVVTALLIIGAAPHIVFLRVLSMPGPSILFCVAGPILLLTLYNEFGWKAPFQLSSTHKGEKVLPGIFYIVEDIVAVNAGGGRPFREGLAARYHASPVFRKMLRDQSWFWSVPALVLGVACTVVVCIHQVPSHIAYGIGWGVPFLWAGIWAAITERWVRAVMHHERTSWEEESAVMQPTAPTLDSPCIGLPLPKEKVSESSTSDATTMTQPDAEAVEDPHSPEDEKLTEHVPSSPENETQPTSNGELRAERSYYDAATSSTPSNPLSVDPLR